MILLLALAILPAAPADELTDARAALTASIESADSSKGSDAASRLGKLGTRAAVEVLVKGLEQTLKAASRLETDIAKLQDSVDDKSDPTKKPKIPATYKVEMQEISDKLAAVHSIRGAVGRALAAVRGDEGTREILRRLKAREDGLLRSYVAAALRENDHAEVLPALLERLTGEDDARVKVFVLDALAAKKPKGADIVPRIAALLKDPAWQVVVGAANALAAIKSTDAIDPLIEGLKKAEGRAKADLNAALVAITGVDKHGDAAAWRYWFDRNRDAVVAGTYKPEPAERPQSGQGGGTTFYGLPVTSRNMVFVIDASMSMKAPSQWKPDLSDTKTLPGDVALAGDRKIDVARFELKKVLAMLPDGAEFNVVFFHRDVDVFSPSMVKLTKEVRQKAFAWIDGLELVLQTNIYEGMKRAFSFGGSAPHEKPSPRATVIKGADTIFLLSDGQPTTGIKDTNEFGRAIAELNRVQRITIHTVAIEPSTGSAKFMQRIAQENGGQYAARGGAARKKQ